jgi:hypothetical protein
MGDRANIVLREKDAPDLYVYTHWSGYEWPEALRTGLLAGIALWGDPQYLNRIVVREVFADLDGVTGGGLSTVVGDNSYDYLVAEHADDRDPTTSQYGYVYLVDPDTGAQHGRRFTFEEFVALPEATWHSFD